MNRFVVLYGVLGKAEQAHAARILVPIARKGTARRVGKVDAVQTADIGVGVVVTVDGEKNVAIVHKSVEQAVVAAGRAGRLVHVARKDHIRVRQIVFTRADADALKRVRGAFFHFGEHAVDFRQGNMEERHGGQRLIVVFGMRHRALLIIPGDLLGGDRVVVAVWQIGAGVKEIQLHRLCRAVGHIHRQGIGSGVR